MLQSHFRLFLWIVFGFCPTAAWADGPADNNPDTVRPVPKAGIEVPEKDRAELEAGLKKLGRMLEELRPKEEFESWVGPYRRHRMAPPDGALLKVWDNYADVAIFHRAVRVALEDQEFFDAKDIEAAKKLLEIGLERAAQLKASDLPWIAPWQKQTGLVVRGYMSKIDHTPQPYGVIIPESYDPAKPIKHRLDLWFHGRGETLSEVNFISQRLSNAGPIAPAETIVLHPYGRYCNANKFAGEIDTFEALQAASRSYEVDQPRIAARGFSMGGAACWQFAVHYPARWFAANPGAGFSETPEFLKFFQKETLNPPWWEEKLWRWYDCPGYVANLRDLPVIAYSGENDIQKQAADLMENAYAKAGMKLLHLIGPKTAHSIHPETGKEIEAQLVDWAASADERYHHLPDHVEFTTYTLIYPQGRWVKIDGMKEQWEQATVVADRQDNGEAHVRTNNVIAMRLHLGGWTKANQTLQVLIDGQRINPPTDDDEPFAFVLEADQWKHAKKIRDRRQPLPLKKQPGLCGPIDHAFMSPFVIVKPSGKSAHPAVQQWVDAEMNRAITQWRRQFRGDARIKLDTEVTEDDLVSANLILWGDRTSNALIGKLADKLPIRWNDSHIAAGDQVFDAANHALMAIYPNPLNTTHYRTYIVLNSGFTFREYDYLNNARQTPKLPDWAVVDLRTPPNSRWPGKIVAADFFDEQWQLKPARKQK